MNPIDRNELLQMIETANETLESANVDEAGLRMGAAARLARRRRVRATRRAN